VIRPLRLLRVAAVLAALAVPLVLSQLAPVRAGAASLLALMRSGSAAGVAAYVAAHALGCIVTAPIWIFSGMAGYAYGPVRGVLLASPANLIATTSAFLLGRFVLASRLGRWLERSPRWSAVRRAVEADAFRITFLLRVMPVAPQNLLSYGLALTPLRLGTFMAATWLGLLPIIVFQVYLGSLVHDVADLLDGTRPPLGAWGWVATGAGVVVTVGALGVTAKLGQRALARQGI
jgi:uncharacterized membrane protein YdjX (TVP38/TMEM64 family)